MALNFPSNPTLNQVHTVGTTSWIWDGTQWTLYVNPTPSFSGLTVTNTLTATNMVGNLTGNVTGNLTGNADTVTNGVYTDGSYFNPSWLTSIPGSIVSGSISGAAGSAARLTTPVQLNGVPFDGSTSISIPVPASSITGSTLPSSITASSLTSVGTLTGLTSANVAINGAINVSSTTGALSYGILSYPDTNIIANFTTDVNSYAQIIIENTNTGNAASTDLIVSNNAGTSTAYFGDFGINSSGFTGTGSLGLPNAVYLYSANSDLSIGTNSNSPIHFVVNGSTTDTMLINSNGVTVNGTTTLNGTSTQLALALNNAGEAVSIITSTIPASVPFYVSTQSIVYYTTVNSTTSGFTLAITGSATTTLNSIMNIGQSVSIALFITNGAGAYFPSTITIDGTTVAPKWANGLVITSGNIFSTDVYNFSIIKTAANTFTVFGSQLRYA